MTVVVDGKPRCRRCQGGIGWTRYIRLAEAGRDMLCRGCVIVLKLRRA